MCEDPRFEGRRLKQHDEDLRLEPERVISVSSLDIQHLRKAGLTQVSQRSHAQLLILLLNARSSPHQRTTTHIEIIRIRKLRTSFDSSLLALAHASVTAATERDRRECHIDDHNDSEVGRYASCRFGGGRMGIYWLAKEGKSSEFRRFVPALEIRPFRNRGVSFWCIVIVRLSSNSDRSACCQSSRAHGHSATESFPYACHHQRVGCENTATNKKFYLK